MEEDTITSKYEALMRANTTFYVRDDALGRMCDTGFGCILGWYSVCELKQEREAGNLIKCGSEIP